jgi:hypothetical protein
VAEFSDFNRGEVAMKLIKCIMMISQVLVAINVSGCKTTERSSGGVPPAALAAIAKIHPGMTEVQVLDLMIPVSLDWGADDANLQQRGPGPHRTYFQIAPDFEVWVAVGDKPDYFVISVGDIEQKKPWYRYSSFPHDIGVVR